MSDSLDTKTDAQISEIFAREVAQLKSEYHLIKHGYYYRPNAAGYTSDINEAGRFPKENAERDVRATNGEVSMRKCPTPDYATDSNAVLPWLEDVTFRIEYNPNCPSGYLIRTAGKNRGRIDGESYYGIGKEAPTKDALTFSTTFARAACIALIRAKRAEKGAAK